MTTTLDPGAPAAAPVPDPPPPPRPRPRWELPTLAGLLVATAALYLWDITASGYANSFYAAAVQAGTQDWKAFFFGSLDPGNAITVDKPPASLWVMALSGRIFGFSSASLLVPQALMAVGVVALLWATVRRIAGPAAGLVAGAVFALTPVAVLMFKFDNPDALLVLLMVGAAYATTRAIEKAGTRWLLLAGVLIGFAFLTKMLQGFLVLPGLVLAYLWAAPTGMWRRIRQVLAAGVAVVVSAGWWIVAVALWPAADRPYIGGSTDNSALELAFGYNGLGRIFGGSGNGGGVPGGGVPGGGVPDGAFSGGGPGGGGGGFGGQTGLGRLFSSEIGGQISWLLPAALLLLVAGLWFTRGAARTDRTRAALLLWGGWTVVTTAVFSLMEGTFHPYYTVALAPGIAALVAVGGHEAWRARDTWTGRGTLAAATALTAVWSFVLLGRTPEFLPWLRWVVLVAGVVVAVVLLVPVGRRRWLAAVAAAAVLVGAAGPAAYAVDTTTTAHQGSIPSAGPSVEGARGGFGGGFGGPAGFGDRDGAGASPAAPGGSGPGEEHTDAALAELVTGAAGARWAAATLGSQSAASLQLATGASVMAIGGFTGSDPAPTLEQFQAWVAAGDVRYFVSGGMGGGPGGGREGRGTGAQIQEWVQQHFTASTVGGRTVYDLSSPTS
ncbi:glycosyl transferase [Pseudonocardia sulfidoxydans NBRC 16205]|uniref:Glycosyl transferase n=1 Tax=Pseudonocardia sulfidoxydans NBRC 16205 TaxID=1223511 RepID=A0A511DKQ1_9PSEU|nr:glycosyltransferase family 39 protein [Pseudonocardia sulfidoxydans]GEL25399.1 glycosyl transferase [Pseudonocardia sulfidoxydans NBRC 16205]